MTLYTQAQVDTLICQALHCATGTIDNLVRENARLEVENAHLRCAHWTKDLSADIREEFDLGADEMIPAFLRRQAD